MWLFDSSLKGINGVEWLTQAKAEHSAYAALLREQGINVHYLKTLLNENKDALKEKIWLALKDAVNKKIIGAETAEDFWKSAQSDIVTASLKGVPIKYKKYEKLMEAGLSILIPKPNAYFVQDPFAIIGDYFVKLKPATWQRRGESELWEIALQASAQKTYSMENISEGGDITIYNGNVFVGIGTRTTDYAAQEIYKMREKFGRIDDVIIVYKPDAKSELGKPHSKEEPFIHIDTIWTPLNDGRNLGNLSLMEKCIVFYNGNGRDDRGELHTLRSFQANGGRTIIAANEEEQYSLAPNVLLANGAVISADVNAKTNKAMANAGLNVKPFSGEALLGGSGSGHCMSNASNYISRL